VFQAIDAMMQCGLTKSLVAQQLAPGIKSLAFDHNVVVREVSGPSSKFGINNSQVYKIHSKIIPSMVIIF